MKTIGIDIGTTTISAVVEDAEDRKLVESRTIQNGSFISGRHEWERTQNADIIVKKAKAVLDELLKRFPDIVYIGLTGQMHGIIYVDDEGKCISPLYTWQDGRGNLVLKNKGVSLVKWIYDICGVNVATGYGLVTHIYNSLYHLVPEETRYLCTISDYLGMVLTENKIPVLHSSNAASLGFFDVACCKFQRAEIEKTGIDTNILPEVTEKIQILGKYKNISVGIAIGDNQASFLGAVGLQEGGILLNMGTGGQISVMSSKYFSIPGIETRPFVNGKYLLVGASLCGGRAYAVLEKFFRQYAVAAGLDNKLQYEVMEKLGIQGEKECDKLFIDTTLCGTRVNPVKRGSICNISEDNFTPAAIVYGVLEGMARELYEMFLNVNESTGLNVEVLVASGNGFRKNGLLRRICSEMFESEVTLAPCEEEAAMGAALGKVLSEEEL